MSKFKLIGILVCLLLAYAIYQQWISFIVALIAGGYLYEFYSRWLGMLSQPYNYNKINEIIYLLLPRLLVCSTAFVLLWWLLQSASIAALAAYVILRLAEFALDRYGLFYLARVQAKSGQFAAAIDSYQQYLHKFENDADVLYDLGCAYLKVAAGDFPDRLNHALVAFSQCLESDPERWEKHVALTEDDEVRQALPEVFFRWGMNRSRAGSDITQAKAAIQRAIELSREDNRDYQRDYQYGLALCELADGAYEAAVAHLRDLLQVEPERSTYLYHLALAQLNLKQVEPAQHLLQQIIVDAKEREWVLHARSLLAALWEQIQKHDPTSDWVTHQLALLYHRSAIELEQEGQTEAADSHWRKAIANWILLIETDAFWERWPAERETVYGKPIPQSNVDKLRRDDLHERLIQIHRDLERAYIRQQQKERAAQHKEYRLLFTWEAKAAAALRETVDLLRQQGQSVELSVIAGPLMLSQLGLLEQAREVATQAQNLVMPAQAEIVHTLTEYLSPFGRLRLLIEEAQAEEAIAELKPLFLQDQNNPLIRRLLVDALIEAGKNLARSQPKEAISRWVEALEYDPENKQVPELLAELSIEFASKWQRGNPQGAIEILKLALRYVPDHKDLKQNLSALQSRRENQQTALTPNPSPNNGRGGRRA